MFKRHAMDRYAMDSSLELLAQARGPLVTARLESLNATFYGGNLLHG
jgi:hypothetical protein